MTLCILGQAFTPAFWVLDFQWRHAVYLKHCENRSKPAMHCDGKCYLKKRIAANTGSDPKAPSLPENFYSIKDLNLYCEPLPAFLIPASGITHTSSLPRYLRHCPVAPASAIFKPPAAV